MNIHEGCTAIVVGGFSEENIGKVTKVGKYLGKVIHTDGRSYHGHDQWETETEMVSRCGVKHFHQREKNLMKICDEDSKINTEETKEVEEKC